MTESEWLSSDDPQAMLRFLLSRASNRKARLLNCAICRATWNELKDERSRRGVEVAELWADGMVTETERLTAMSEANQAWFEQVRLATKGELDWRTSRLSGDAAFTLLFSTASLFGFHAGQFGLKGWLRRIAALLGHEGSKKIVNAKRVWNAPPEVCCELTRDIFGNPFRPMKFDPSWRVTSTHALASEIYDKRAFSRLPELAAALEAAGCNNHDILSHCRGGGVHVRGCFLVDLILGKS